MPRVYTRRFDYDEARRRVAAGESLRALAAEYGVTTNAIRYATIPGLPARMSAANKQWRTVTCEICGGPAMKLTGGKLAHNVDGRVLCASCRSIEKRDSIIFSDTGKVLAIRCTMIKCANGERWQPPNHFPHGKRYPDLRDGGFHGLCRACNTAARRAYRDARKVPCSHGCGAMVLHENGGKEPECRPCAARRVQAERMKVAA